VSFRQQYLGGKCFTNRSLTDHETILNLEIGVTRLATAAPVAQVGFSGLSLSELETIVFSASGFLPLRLCCGASPTRLFNCSYRRFVVLATINEIPKVTFLCACLSSVYVEFVIVIFWHFALAAPRTKNCSTYEILAVDAWNPIFSRATRPSFLGGDLRAFCPPPR